MSASDLDLGNSEMGAFEMPDNNAEAVDIPMAERRDEQSGATYKRSIYALPVKVQMVIGTARPTIADLLRLKAGSVLELDKSISDPVDVCIDNRVIARGELIETDVATGEIGLKITEIVDISEDLLSS